MGDQDDRTQDPTGAPAEAQDPATPDPADPTGTPAEPKDPDAAPDGEPEGDDAA